jgi:low affinity Fe/Cu permease
LDGVGLYGRNYLHRCLGDRASQDNGMGLAQDIPRAEVMTACLASLSKATPYKGDGSRCKSGAGRHTYTRTEESMKFQYIADRAARWAGSRWAFMFAFGTVLVWAASGPYFHWSDSHSLFINTATTIVTFLMVFLIQNSQNRGDAAIQVKLDELIRTSEESRNELVGLETKPEEEIVQAAEEVRRIVTEEGLP